MKPFLITRWLKGLLSAISFKEKSGSKTLLIFSKSLLPLVFSLPLFCGGIIQPWLEYVFYLSFIHKNTFSYRLFDNLHTFSCRLFYKPNTFYGRLLGAKLGKKLYTPNYFEIFTKKTRDLICYLLNYFHFGNTCLPLPLTLIKHILLLTDFCICFKNCSVNL